MWSSQGDMYVRANAQHVAMPTKASSAPVRPPREFAFQKLAGLDGTSLAGASGLTFLLSLVAHGVVVAACRDRQRAG